ncbi:unnamed protein product [Lota lota]
MRAEGSGGRGRLASYLAGVRSQRSRRRKPPGAVSVQLRSSSAEKCALPKTRKTMVSPSQASKMADSSRARL